MHRHGYKGRKFGRETDQREALLKGLAVELIDHRSITTTMPKAKELRPFVEKLVTRAKIGDLHSRRILISRLSSATSAHTLVDEIAPALKDRQSGYLSIKRSGFRKGDNAEMATIKFVDDTTPKTAAKKVETEAPKAKVEAKQPVKKAETK